MSPPSRLTIVLARPPSAAAGSHKNKRLSLNLPLQPNGVHDSARHTPSSSASTTPTTATSSVIASDPQVSPGGAGSFLTALAAQERRVLELREDLQRAEADLAQLKSQWAMHEMTRKRCELQHVEQLRTFGMPPSDMISFAEEGVGPSRFFRELDSRKAAGGDISPTKRKMFSGSRHMRTLSLLSSNATNDYKQPLSSGEAASQSDNGKGPADPLFRSSRMPMSLGQTRPMRAENGADHRPSTRDLPRDAILRTGKRMAVDFKAGLWTFIEDLRQATVGDEGISATQSRSMLASPAKGAHKHSTGMTIRSTDGQRPVWHSSNVENSEASPRTAGNVSALVGVGGVSGLAPATENSRAQAIVSTPGLIQQPAQGEGAFDDESWGNWDSPSSKMQASDCTGNSWLSDMEISSPLHGGMSSTWYVWTRIRSIPLIAIIIRLFFSPRQYLSSQ